MLQLTPLALLLILLVTEAMAESIGAMPVEGYSNAIIAVNGSARFAGALTLTFPETRNERGGISGIEIAPDGNTIWAISDRREWIEFSLVIEDKKLVGISNASISDTKIDKKYEPESLARSGNHLHIGAEKTPAILTFAIDNGGLDLQSNANTWTPPKPMKSILLQTPGKPPVAGNFGLESLTSTHAGGLYGWQDASLYYSKPNPIPMWELTAFPQFEVTRFEFRPKESELENEEPVLYQDAIRVTGASTLNRQDVYFLERTYYTNTQKTKARVSRLVRSQDIYTGESLFIIRSIGEAPIENFEALTVFRRNDHTYALLASDDRLGTSSAMRFGKQQRPLIMLVLLD